MNRMVRFDSSIYAMKKHVIRLKKGKVKPKWPMSLINTHFSSVHQIQRGMVSFLIFKLAFKKNLCSLKSLKTYTVVHNIHKQTCVQKILSTNTDYAGNLLIFHVTQLWFMTRNLPNWWLSRPSSTFMYISTSPSQSSVSLSKTVIIFSVFSWCFYGNFAPTVYYSI